MSISFESDRRSSARRDDDYCPMTKAQVDEMLHDMKDTKLITERNKQSLVLVAEKIKSMCDRITEIKDNAQRDHDMLMERSGPIGRIKHQEDKIEKILENQANIKAGQEINKAYGRAAVWLIGSLGGILTFIQLYINFIGN